jgi:hypothetical protein
MQSFLFARESAKRVGAIDQKIILREFLILANLTVALHPRNPSATSMIWRIDTAREGGKKNL